MKPNHLELVLDQLSDLLFEVNFDKRLELVDDVRRFISARLQRENAAYLTLEQLASRWACSPDQAAMRLYDLGVLRLKYDYTEDAPYRLVLTRDGYECSRWSSRSLVWDVEVLEGRQFIVNTSNGEDKEKK